MSVTAINASTTAAYIGRSSRTAAATAVGTEDGRGGESEVSISAAGRQALEAEAATRAGQAATGTAAPGGIEQYRVTPWLSDYFPATSLNQDTQGSAQYTTQEAAHPQWFAAAQSTRDDYSSRFSAHYDAVLKDNGIDSRDKEYQQLVVDGTRSGQLHQQLRERLQSDPQMVALMRELGISTAA